MSQQYYPLGMSLGGGGGSPSTFTATASRTDIYKYSPTPGATVTTPSTTVTPSGGTAPYTYAWTSSGYQSANSPSSAATTFSVTGRGIASDDIQNWLCSITDNVGALAYVNVQVEIQVGGLMK